MWLTEDQLGGPEFLNIGNHAEIISNSGELEACKHHYKSRADAGVMEYCVTKEWLETVRNTRQSSGVVCEQDLKPEEYEEIKAAMEANLHTAAPAAPEKSKCTATIAPKVKELKVGVGTIGQALRNLK